MTVNQSNRRRGLSLLKRVQVIQEFESTWPRTPFGHLADKFNVSTEHIRYIIYKKDNVLKAYEDSLIPKVNKPKPQMMKQLSLSQRFEILKLYEFSYPKVKIKELAAEFGVTGPLIRRVLDKQVEILRDYEKQCVKQSVLHKFQESSDSSDDTHTPGVLNGIDQLAIMHEYNYKHPRPSKSSLADKYKVSSQDISHVLLDYDITILARVKEEKRTEFNLREEQIKFLNMVMLEYLQRAQCHNILPLDDATFQAKATEVIESIALIQFKPSSLWLYMFKRIHGIVDFSKESLASMRTDGKPKSLHTRDLIDYVCLEKTRFFKDKMIRKRNKQYLYYKRKQCKTYSITSRVRGSLHPPPSLPSTVKTNIYPEYSKSHAIRKKVPEDTSVDITQRFHSNTLATSDLINAFKRISSPEDEHIETFNFNFDNAGQTITTEQQSPHEADEMNSETGADGQHSRSSSPAGGTTGDKQDSTHETDEINSESDERQHSGSSSSAGVTIKNEEQSTHDTDETNSETNEDNHHRRSISVADATMKTDPVELESENIPAITIKTDMKSVTGKDQHWKSKSVARITIKTDSGRLESESYSVADDTIKTNPGKLKTKSISSTTKKTEEETSDETEEINSETGEDQDSKSLSVLGVSPKTDSEEFESEQIEWLTGEEIAMASDSPAVEDIRLAESCVTTTSIKKSVIIRTAQKSKITPIRISADHHSGPFTTASTHHSREAPENIESSHPFECLENIKIEKDNQSRQESSKKLSSGTRASIVAPRYIAISTSREVLRILEVLENYFLATGNFSAIILMAQLKEAFKKVLK